MKRHSVMPSQTVFVLVLSMALAGGCFPFQGTETGGAGPDGPSESVAFTVDVSSENPVFRPALQFRASGEDAAASAVPVTVTIDYGDGTTHTETVGTSSYLAPSHSYETSESPRTALLTVSPWSEALVINLGFRAGDDGNNTGKTDAPLIDYLPPLEGIYANSGDTLSEQAIWEYAGKVLSVANLQAAVNLQAFCCERQPIEELDLSGLSKLRTLEGFLSKIKSTNFQGCAELRRCCLEQTGANASWRMVGGTRMESEELDLRDSPLLQDIRGTGDDHVRLRLAEGAKATLWHLCKMENYRMGKIAFGDGPGEAFNPSEFTSLLECWVAGSPFLPPQLVISNDVTASVFGWGNTGVTSVDASGQEQLLDLRLDGNELTAVNIAGCPNLQTLSLRGCGLSAGMVDSILETLNGFGTSLTPAGDADVDLSSDADDAYPNEPPSAAGLTALNALRERGWVILTNE